MDLTLAEIIGIVLGLLALIGTFVALYFAYDQFRKARETTGRLEDVATNLEEVSETILTRTVGHFPEFMNDLVDVVKKDAKESIIVFCDHPGYGIFSNETMFDEYSRVIQKKLVDKISVKLICLEPNRRIQLHEDQFRVSEAEWPDWKQDPKNKKCMDTFLSTYLPNEKTESVTRQKFLEGLEIAHRDVLERHFDGADKLETHLPMPLYFWIRDNEEAFFVLAVFTEDTREIGFYTRDHRLIGALKAIFRRYTKEEERYRKEEEETRKKGERDQALTRDLTAVIDRHRQEEEEPTSPEQAGTRTSAAGGGGTPS